MNKYLEGDEVYYFKDGWTHSLVISKVCTNSYWGYDHSHIYTNETQLFSSHEECTIINNRQKIKDIWAGKGANIFKKYAETD